jgi:hypothetical protein
MFIRAKTDWVQIRNREATAPWTRRWWPAKFLWLPAMRCSGEGARATRQGGGSAGGASGRRAPWRGGFQGGAARPKGNGSEGWHLVVAVNSSRFRKVAGAWAIV